MSKAPVETRSRTSPFKRIGPFLPVLIVLGIATPMLIYLGVMQSLGWRVPVVSLNGGVTSVASVSNSVILYNSPSTEVFIKSIGGNYENLLAPWRAYFTSRRESFREIKDATQLAEITSGVLILPSAVALNDRERSEILAFRARGGSILNTWATGARKGNGEWEGWGFLKSLGIEMLGEIATPVESSHLTLNGESPVNNSLPAGQRIGLARTSEALLRFQGEQVGARLMNWARITDSERRDEGAIIFSEPESGGRTISFSFSETAWESRPQAMHVVIDDSLRWLQRVPTAVLGTWPQNKRAAQVFTMDSEDNFQNALVFASRLKAAGLPATFYVLTSVGRRHPEVLVQLGKDFDLGYHGDVHDSFKGLPAKLQEQRMQIMLGELGTVLADATTVTGFRAPLEGYDGTTERLLPAIGVRHHAADPSRSEARLPLMAKLENTAPGGALVVLPRTQRDDINLANTYHTVDQTAEALTDDFDLALEQGALGFLSVHSQTYFPDSVLDQAMQRLISHVTKRKERVWIASSAQVADWWLQRERLRLSSDMTGKRFTFNITLSGDAPVSNVSVVLMLPEKGVLPGIQAEKVGAPKPVIVPIDDYRAAVVFPTLAPGNYGYQATFTTR